MNRNRLAVCAALFAVAETLAIIYALWSSPCANAPAARGEIRIGVVPAVSRNRSSEQWEGLIKDFNEKLDCPLSPYFANSHEEAISGLLNGSLDLLYTNPAVFISVNATRKLRPWLYHKVSRKEKELLRSVLVSAKPAAVITDTKGFRLTFTDPNSMTGCIVPLRFIEGKLPPGLSEWFSGISYAYSDSAAFEALLDGRTDLIACDRLALEEAIALYGDKAKGLNIVWMSLALPENLVCSIDAIPSLPEESRNKLLDACKELSMHKPREEFLTEKSMTFLPIDHSYTESLSSLERYLRGAAAPPPAESHLPPPSNKEKRL